MERNKIIELKLIENAKKTKKNIYYDLDTMKQELYTIIDNLIEYDFSYIKNKESLDYLNVNL